LTSDRKIKANRANARMSTGPKTRHGRARSAKNAFRHGLSLAVSQAKRFVKKCKPSHFKSLGGTPALISKCSHAKSPKRRSICAAYVTRAVNSFPRRWPTVTVMSLEHSRG